jgi:hypothetical protein
MGRFVVIEFEDTDAAEAFVKNENLPDQLAFSVWGLYYRPTVLCKCGGKRNLKDWGKSKRFGVPLCRTCKRVSPAWASGVGVRLKFALGNNILP